MNFRYYTTKHLNDKKISIRRPGFDVTHGFKSIEIKIEMTNEIKVRLANILKGEARLEALSLQTRKSSNSKINNVRDRHLELALNYKYWQASLKEEAAGFEHMISIINMEILIAKSWRKAWRLPPGTSEKALSKLKAERDEAKEIIKKLRSLLKAPKKNFEHNRNSIIQRAIVKQ